ncbi:MAG: ribonuclease Z, partial [Bacteroidia bacterium]|nr:ribonuclease Z [Bacteroidia bacterium]
REKITEKNIRKSAIEKYKLSIEQIKSVKSGEDLLIDEMTIDNRQLTYPNPVPRSYAYCADSIYEESLLNYISGVHTLYFETTYLDDMKEQARERGHCTARQAGELARKAGVKTLITGHYSSRYKDLNPILEEAKSEFENVILGQDGLVVEIVSEQ